MKVIVALATLIAVSLADSKIAASLTDSKKVREGFQGLGEELGDLADRVGVLEKLGPTKGGRWHLGMNIDPADGHIFGYVVGWATGEDIGSEDAALKADYLSAEVWEEPANYIAIVRHQEGVVDAVKVWQFKYWGKSLLTRFGLKKMDPGRQIVTSGGPIQESIAEEAENLVDDPIFSVDGDLAFNWAYSNNGCRIALTGGYLSPADQNDDNTHGLGNDFRCDPLENRSTGSLWVHDVSNIQDCPLGSCVAVRLQGTDHGAGSSLRSGPVYGNYAIYVSQDAKTFPEPGFQLETEIQM